MYVTEGDIKLALDYLDYTGLEQHIRLNLATQRKIVEEAFDRIRNSFK